MSVEAESVLLEAESEEAELDEEELEDAESEDDEPLSAGVELDEELAEAESDEEELEDDESEEDELDCVDALSVDPPSGGFASSEESLFSGLELPASAGSLSSSSSSFCT